MSAPVATRYLRTPEANRELYRYVRDAEQTFWTAAYIGCATGEDFVTWPAVGWAAGVVIEWTVIEIDEQALNTTRSKFPIFRGILGNYRKCDLSYDIVIANYIWEHVEDTMAGLAHIAHFAPRVIIVHGMETVGLPLGYDPKPLPDGYFLVKHD